MRIFAALELPPGTRAEIASWQAEMGRSYDGLKWVDPRLCHVTLRFLGEVGPDRVEETMGILASWKPGPLPFTLESAGIFGGPGRTSVHWMGGSFPLEIEALALRLGRVPDDRGRVHHGSFVPHITVARSRAEDDRRRLPDPPRMSGSIGTASVIDSLLTPRGPEYRIVRRFDLSATDGAAGGLSDGR